MTSIRNLKFRIAANEKFFNNIQITSKSNTEIQQRNNNTVGNIQSFSKFTEFIYDFAIDRFEDFDDDVSTNFKFQYFVRLKIYVTWQNEQRVLIQIERDMIIKIAVKRANEIFISAVATIEKKSIIKIQKKTLDTYKRNSIYAIYDEYVMKMKQQFDFNNINHKKDMHAQKIDFAIIFLKSNDQKAMTLSHANQETCSTYMNEFQDFLAR